MLKVPNRPRAPSTATLKILYQLAYISSGTALGVGVLCAEERRRRIQVVQKIAENAKKIRQSPRYNHNAATAVAGDAFHAYGLHGDVTHDARVAFLDPDLPSVIDREYEHTNRDARRAKRNHKYAEEESEGSAPVAHTPANVRISRRSPRRVINEREASTPSTHTPAHIQHKHTKQWGLQDMRKSDAILDQNRLKQLSRNAKAKEAALAALKARYDRDPRERYTWSVLRGKHWANLSLAEKEGIAKHLTSDTAHFFNAVSSSSSVSQYSIDEADRIARKLMLSAAELGYLRDAASLVLWRLAINRIREDDTMLLAKAWNNFTAKGSSWDIFARQKETFRPLTLRTKLDSFLETKHGSTFAAGAHDALMTTMTRQSDLQWSQPLQDIWKALLKCCHNLIDNDHLGAAVYLLTSCPFGDWASTRMNLLISRLFSKAVSTAQLPLCDIILKWTGGHLSNALFSRADINAFVTTCGRAKAYDILHAVFNEQNGAYDCSVNVKLLYEKGFFDASSFLQLCFTFAYGPRKEKGLFKQCYKHLSAEKRELFPMVDDVSGADSLMMAWIRTRNFDKTWTKYTSLAKDISEAKATHIAMIKVCLTANEYDKAKEVLAVLDSLGYPDDVYAMALLACAHTHDWEMLESMIRDMSQQTQKSFEMGTLEEILRVYSKHHDAAQVQDLCVLLLSNLQLAPSLQITTTVLKRAVIEQKHEVLREWFRVCTTRGWEVAMTPELLTSLLREYSLNVRAHHSMIMGMAHWCYLGAPELVGSDLRDVVKDAITYDMRHYALHRHGDDTRYKRAAARLEHLLRSPGIPHPGNVCDGKLVLYNHEGLPKRRAGLAYQDLSSHRKRLYDEAEVEITTQDTRVDALLDQENLSDNDQRGCRPNSNQPAYTPILDQYTTTSLAEEDEKEIILTRNEVNLPTSAIASAFINGTASESLGDVTLSKQSKPEHNFTTQRSSTRTKMLLALTSHAYRDVLALYFKSCARDGLPQSALLLEIALEASLRLRNGDAREAHAMLADAESAGMNTATVIGPLLMHRLKTEPVSSKRVLRTLRHDVIKYFHENIERSGRGVNDYLAVVAADRFIRGGRAREAVELLETLCERSLLSVKKLDVAVATVWIKAHIRNHDIVGVRNLVDHMLKAGTRMDRLLIQTLELAEKALWVLFEDEDTQLFTQKDRAILKSCRKLCAQKLREQKQMVSWFLPRLTTEIVRRYRFSLTGPKTRAPLRSDLARIVG